MKIRSFFYAAAAALVMSSCARVSETTVITGTSDLPGLEQVAFSIPNVIDTLVPVVDGKYQLSYGYYTGDIKDGYPHGQGRLTYTVERQINKYDMKKRTAKVGQYVIGEFQRGFFIQGRLYAADGELLESIMIGTAPGDTYEKL